MPLKKRLVAYRDNTIINKGTNLSSLFSMVMDSMILNLFNAKSVMIGKTNVVPNITARHISDLIKDNSHIPENMKIRNIHVGNKIG